MCEFRLEKEREIRLVAGRKGGMGRLERIY